MKKCKYCGTEKEEDFVRKSGKTGVTVCTKCMINNSMGQNNPSYKKKHFQGIYIKIDKSKKQCKHCGTKNIEDFIYPSGHTFNTICIKCNSLNLIKNNTGEKNPMYNKSPSIDTRAKMSNSRRGEKNHMFNKNTSCEVRLKQSMSSKTSYENFKKKYSLICIIEETRKVPEDEWEIGMSSVQFHCKKCNKWFTPSILMVTNRNKSLKGDIDGNYFYCSSECKNSCSLFGLRPNNYINNLNHSNNEIIRTSPEYQIFRKEVLNRQLKIEWYNHCEMCYATIGLNIHHEKSVKTHPHLALDPDNGIILCRSCHLKFGHKDECSTGALAQMICTPIINKEE